VQHYSEACHFDKLVLSREFRAGSGPAECTSTSADQLLGSWQGQASTVIAYWPEPETSDCQLELVQRSWRDWWFSPIAASLACRSGSATAGRLCPRAAPAGIAAGRSGVFSMLHLRPVPGRPTVVRGPPLRAIGMLNEAPRPPTEMELNPLLPKLKRKGPRRAERRNRKAMAISDF